MKQHIIVVGAGINGAVLAYHLAQGGAQVTVIEAQAPAAAASGRSFGWINASFYLDETHFHLRHAGIAAWQSLGRDLGGLGLHWPGCLWWEEEGAGFDRKEAELLALGYPCRRVSRDEFALLEPAVACPPERSLLFPSEGAVDLAEATERLLAAAATQGAVVWTGVAVTGFRTAAGRIKGVDTPAGPVAADQVVLATGTATSGLAAGVGVTLPMLDRPGVLVRTQPCPPLLHHILAAPGQELRQTLQGHILAPASAAHQTDTAEVISETPDRLAGQALARLGALLPATNLRADRVLQAWRPVPADGLPAVGPTEMAGLYIVTLHSGATLAAHVGHLAATEILTGVADPALGPFRPARFA